jgi:hypothetical protein
LSSAERRSQDDSDGIDGDRSFPPVTCIVAKGLLTWAIDTTEELAVPALAFHKSSAFSFLAYQIVPKLLELGEFPFPEGGDLDEPLRGVPGMDLPRVCRRRGGTASGVGLDPHPARVRQGQRA